MVDYRHAQIGMLIVRLLAQVRKVRALKNNIIQRQELLCNEKMLKVEQKRQLMLKEKIKKAQEEEAKVS